MKLLQVYNRYRSDFNGEDAVVEKTAALVEQHGGETQLLTRSSREVERSFFAKLSAAWSGIYSRTAYRQMQQLLHDDRPDVVHVHNLYPLFSPSILVACREARVPVVMSVHNQHLTCPTADHLHRGEVCERCVGGNEHHCVLQNCRGDLLESIAYAARSVAARRWRLFHENVTLFIALSRFAKSRLVAAGFAADQISVLPNTVKISDEAADPAIGKYIAFAGRLSSEKGVETLLAAAELLPECQFRLAGNGPLFDSLRQRATSNVQFLGRLASHEMPDFYRHARCVVLPSHTYEMCPLTILEAMAHGLPVVASRRGAQVELVDDERTGLLCEAANPHDLARKLERLWNEPETCQQMGRIGYEQAQRLYNDESYYYKLRAIYDRAIEAVTPAMQHVSTAEDHETLVCEAQP